MALSPALEKLKDSLSCVTYNGAQHTHILIEERDACATLKNVILQVGSGDWFSFNPDEGRKCKRLDRKSNLVLMSPLLTISRHDHHRACDAVVVLNRGGQLTLVYLDLKSSNPDGYAGQFKSTRQFVRYAVSLLEEFHQQKLTIADERYVILYGGKPTLINKTTSIPRTDKIQKTKPDSAYKREVSNRARIYLKEFLS